MSAPVDVEEIVFRYENGLEMKLTGEQARSFLVRTLGTVKDLNEFNWNIGESSQKKKRIFDRIKDLHNWFMNI